MHMKGSEWVAKSSEHGNLAGTSRCRGGVAMVAIAIAMLGRGGVRGRQVEAGEE